MNTYDKNRCIVNDAFQIIEPNLHDANLLCIDVSKKNTVVLTFKLTTNQKINLYLNGIERLVCNNFNAGNTVLDMTILNTDNALKRNILKVFITTLGYKSAKENEHLKTLKDTIKEKKLILIELNPSYGCELAALVSSTHYELLTSE